MTLDEIKDCLNVIPSDSESEPGQSSSDEDEQIAHNIGNLSEDNYSDDEDTQDQSNQSCSSSNKSATNEYVPKWRKKEYDHTIPNFTEYCGENKDVFANLINISPIGIFDYFLDEEICNHIVFETNLYATQKGTKYKPITNDELKCFIGINFLMAMKKQPSYKDYWSSDIF